MYGIDRMAMTRSDSTSALRPWWWALAAGMVAVAALPAAAQEDDAAAACAGFLTPTARAECNLSVGAARLLQPRLAVALFGGNAVPGTASTLGMRLGSLPRTSIAFRMTLASATLAPIVDRSESSSSNTLLLGLGTDIAVGVLPGFSPLPTVGGVASLDLIARLAYAPLPADELDDSGALGFALGARLGALRESFTLPGVSATATWGRISSTALGDPEDATTDGFIDGAITELRLGAEATKRLGLVGLTGGVAWSRYASDLTAGFRESISGAQLVIEEPARTNRWSAWADASFTMLIFHAVVEVGWQQAPVPEGIPAGVTITPSSWSGGLSFRISI